MAFKPTDGMKTEAQRGLDWRREYGRGGTEVGIARARDIVNSKNLSESTVKRMYSFFSRHEVDKQGEGFSQGEDGYPSNGRIAWALWGGDAGYSWSKQIVERLKKEDEREYEARPYANEHAARLKDPSQYDSFARENDALGDGIDAIYGIKEGVSELQAIRFDAERYTPEQAREWLDEHDFEPIEFEEAIGEKADSMSNDIDEHPVEITEEKTMLKEDRHILSVSETDNSVIVEFEKHNEDVEQLNQEEDRDLNAEMVYRSVDLSRASYLDEEKRRVRIGVSSEEPVERNFGMEVLSHSEGDVDMEFIASGRAPLLLDHDMTKQIGVIEEYKLDAAKKKSCCNSSFW